LRTKADGSPAGAEAINTQSQQSQRCFVSPTRLFERFGVKEREINDSLKLQRLLSSRGLKRDLYLSVPSGISAPRVRAREEQSSIIRIIDGAIGHVQRLRFLVPLG
jgi:hypothetical protein